MRTKEFGSLLQLLQLSQQSGLLWVSCSGEAWQARLQLQEGIPKSCHIVQRPDMKVLMSGQSAIEWLSHRGELEWSLEELSSPARKEASTSHHSWEEVWTAGSFRCSDFPVSIFDESPSAPLPLC
jgi:hypothetical protein